MKNVTYDLLLPCQPLARLRYYVFSDDEKGGFGQSPARKGQSNKVGVD